MTKHELEQYQFLVEEIKIINKKIMETKNAEPVKFGTVRGSSKYFPYTAMTFTVAGIDPADSKQREQQVSQLLKQGEFQLNELLRKRLEIETYISNIKESKVRMIFRLYFLEGMTQQQVACRVNYDQSRISRIINQTVKTHKKHK